MPTTKTVHQERWDAIVRDPALHDLPYKVETNSRGQIVLSPQKNRHSYLQKAVESLLDRLLPDGEAFSEFAIATESGVKQPDVVWMSDERRASMTETGDPTTLAPEICVEVLSPANTEAEMKTKRALYREAGAEEVWIVGEDGTVRFFADEKLDASRLAPDAPGQVEAA